MFSAGNADVICHHLYCPSKNKPQHVALFHNSIQNHQAIKKNKKKPPQSID